MKGNIKIKKIKEVPFRVNSEEDEVLVSGLTMKNRMDALEELRYLKDTKQKVLDNGTLVYYKGNRNAVYFSYSR